MPDAIEFDVGALGAYLGHEVTPPSGSSTSPSSYCAAAILQGILKRAQDGTANSVQAVATGSKARMFAVFAVFASSQFRSTEVPHPAKET